jgi:DNA anti-recombination protein RmuC
MAIDEQSRRELHDRLEEALGSAPAETLMASLPPQGWADVATKDDLARVEERFTARLDAMDERFTARFDGLSERFDLKLDSSANELRADFRGEINAAITAQTRTVILALFGTLLSSGGLVLAAARLG